MERFLHFNQELLALVRAGLPILQSFDIMLERQKDVRFREILTDIRDKLKSGVSLSDAFASYGDLFPPIYSTSLRAGERSGDLEGVLRRFLKYQKMIVALRKKVISALIYPIILNSNGPGVQLWFDFSTPLQVMHDGLRIESYGIPKGDNCTGDFEIQGVITAD